MTGKSAPGGLDQSGHPDKPKGKKEHTYTFPDLGPVKVLTEDVGFITQGTLAELVDPHNLNAENLQDIYQFRNDDFEAPDVLEVWYMLNGTPHTETLFVDTLMSGERPRICVSVKAVRAMHTAIAVLTRKLDNTLITLRSCRHHYHQELIHLRELLARQRSGISEEHDAHFFCPTKYEDQVTVQLFKDQLKEATVELELRLTEKQSEIRRLQQALAVCEAGMEVNDMRDRRALEDELAKLQEEYEVLTDMQETTKETMASQQERIGQLEEELSEAHETFKRQVERHIASVRKAEDTQKVVERQLRKERQEWDKKEAKYQSVIHQQLEDEMRAFAAQPDTPTSRSVEGAEKDTDGDGKVESTGAARQAPDGKAARGPGPAAEGASPGGDGLRGSSTKSRTAGGDELGGSPNSTSGAKLSRQSSGISPRSSGGAIIGDDGSTRLGPRSSVRAAEGDEGSTRLGPRSSARAAEGADTGTKGRRLSSLKRATTSGRETVKADSEGESRNTSLTRSLTCDEMVGSTAQAFKLDVKNFASEGWFPAHQSVAEDDDEHTNEHAGDHDPELEAANEDESQGHEAKELNGEENRNDKDSESRNRASRASGADYDLAGQAGGTSASGLKATDENEDGLEVDRSVGSSGGVTTPLPPQGSPSPTQLPSSASTPLPGGTDSRAPMESSGSATRDQVWYDSMASEESDQGREKSKDRRARIRDAVAGEEEVQGRKRSKDHIQRNRKRGTLMSLPTIEPALSPDATEAPGSSARGESKGGILKGRTLRRTRAEDERMTPDTSNRSADGKTRDGRGSTDVHSMQSNASIRSNSSLHNTSVEDKLEGSTSPLSRSSPPQDKLEGSTSPLSRSSPPQEKLDTSGPTVSWRSSLNEKTEKQGSANRLSPLLAVGAGISTSAFRSPLPRAGSGGLGAFSISPSASGRHEAGEPAEEPAPDGTLTGSRRVLSPSFRPMGSRASHRSEDHTVNAEAADGGLSVGGASSPARSASRAALSRDASLKWRPLSSAKSAASSAVGGQNGAEKQLVDASQQTVITVGYKPMGEQPPVPVFNIRPIDTLLNSSSSFLIHAQDESHNDDIMKELLALCSEFWQKNSDEFGVFGGGAKPRKDAPTFPEVKGIRQHFPHPVLRQAELSIEGSSTAATVAQMQLPAAKATFIQRDLQKSGDSGFSSGKSLSSRRRPLRREDSQEAEDELKLLLEASSTSIRRRMGSLVMPTGALKEQNPIVEHDSKGEEEDLSGSEDGMVGDATLADTLMVNQVASSILGLSPKVRQNSAIGATSPSRARTHDADEDPAAGPRSVELEIQDSAASPGSPFSTRPLRTARGRKTASRQRQPHAEGLELPELRQAAPMQGQQRSSRGRGNHIPLHVAFADSETTPEPVTEDMLDRIRDFVHRENKREASPGPPPPPGGGGGATVAAFSGHASGISTGATTNRASGGGAVADITFGGHAGGASARATGSRASAPTVQGRASPRPVSRRRRSDEGIGYMPQAYAGQPRSADGEVHLATPRPTSRQRTDDGWFPQTARGGQTRLPLKALLSR